MSEKELQELEYLINQARKARMSDSELAEQRMSFAYGNSAFENPMITKEMVENEARKLAAE